MKRRNLRRGRSSERGSHGDLGGRGGITHASTSGSGDVGRWRRRRRRRRRLGRVRVVAVGEVRVVTCTVAGARPSARPAGAGASAGGAVDALEDAALLDGLGGAGDDGRHDQGPHGAGPVLEVRQHGAAAAVDGTLLAALLARERAFGAVELGLVELPERRRELLGLQGRAEDGGHGRGQEGFAQVRVLDGAAVEGVAGDVETLGEELGLLADRVGDGGGELAREREVARHLARKVLGRVEGIVDVPFELVDKSVGSDGDIELDEDAHVVIFVGVVGQVRVQGVLVDEDVRVEVLDLVGERAGDALGERARLVERQAEVLDELAGKVIGRDEALVQVPGEGVAKLDPVELDVEPHGHELLEPVGLGGAVGARGAQLLRAASARPLALGRVQHARLDGVGVAVAVAGVAVAEDDGRVGLALAPQGLVEFDLSSLGAHRALERGGMVTQGGGVQMVAREVLIEQQVAGRRPGPMMGGSSILGRRVGCGVGAVLGARLIRRRGRRRSRRRGGSRQQGPGAFLAGADGLAGSVGSLVEIGRQLVGKGRGRVGDDGWDDVEAQHGRFGHDAHRAGVGPGPRWVTERRRRWNARLGKGGGGGGGGCCRQRRESGDGVHRLMSTC